jgi:hypothetical protein
LITIIFPRIFSHLHFKILFNNNNKKNNKKLCKQENIGNRRKKKDKKLNIEFQTNAIKKNS